MAGEGCDKNSNCYRICIYWVIQIANKKAVLRVSNVSDSAGDKALLQF